LGLEQAGFEPEALIDLDKHCCSTLAKNRPSWNVINSSLNDFSGASYQGVDLIAGGLPCPPFSVAGKQLGREDDRNLFPAAVRIIDEIRPKAVMIENVRGILGAVFEDYRQYISGQIASMGFKTAWRLMNASDYGVSQLRPRVVFIAVKSELFDNFQWPTTLFKPPPTVGELLFDLMSEGGWRGAGKWKKLANDIAPTIVGGSQKHGGPDLGPTRARKAWATLGVEGKSIADAPPDRNFVGIPRLTVRMVARIQGFPDDWMFSGKKTAAYRQVGNAFPPPVAGAVASQLMQCLTKRRLFTTGTAP